MLPRLTYANVMATAALFITLGGSAIAATVVTGKGVKNGSLLNADLKGSSVGAADLAPSARAQLVGPKGAQGTAGSKGGSGIQGGKGPDGPRGSAARMTSAFAFRDTGLITHTADSFQAPNSTATAGTGTDWDHPNYGIGNGAAAPNMRPAGAYHQLDLTAGYQPALALRGMGGPDAARSSDTSLTPTFADGVMNATATVTLMHRASDENFATNSGTTVLNGRVQCGLFYGTSADPTALTSLAGVRAHASSDQLHELVVVSLHGNASGMVPGTSYNVTAKCRDADYTGTTQWQVVSGNLTTFISQ